MQATSLTHGSQKPRDASRPSRASALTAAAPVACRAAVRPRRLASSLAGSRERTRRGGRRGQCALAVVRDWRVSGNEPSAVIRSTGPVPTRRRGTPPRPCCNKQILDTRRTRQGLAPPDTGESDLDIFRPNPPAWPSRRTGCAAPASWPAGPQPPAHTQPGSGAPPLREGADTARLDRLARTDTPAGPAPSPWAPAASARNCLRRNRRRRGLRVRRRDATPHAMRRRAGGGLSRSRAAPNGRGPPTAGAPSESAAAAGVSHKYMPRDSPARPTCASRRRPPRGSHPAVCGRLSRYAPTARSRRRRCSKRPARAKASGRPGAGGRGRAPSGAPRPTPRPRPAAPAKARGEGGENHCHAAPVCRGSRAGQSRRAQGAEGAAATPQQTPHPHRGHPVTASRLGAAGPSMPARPLFGPSPAAGSASGSRRRQPRSCQVGCTARRRCRAGRREAAGGGAGCGYTA